jgi:carboxyl-terminal processing protease
MRKIRKVKFIFVSSLTVVIFLAGFIGYLFGNHNFALAEKGFPTFSNRDLGAPKDTDFSLFWEAYSKLKENYIGKIDGQKLLYGAIYGAYASVDDPYTVFLDPEVSKDFQNELSGELEGIGIKIGMLNGYPAVIAPLDGSPAQKSGLKPKDKIFKINDVDTKDLPLDEVVSKIRGKEGTTVKLSVLREGEDNTRNFELKREKLDVKTVEVKYIDDVAVISLNEFGISTKKDFAKIADEISSKGISKMILDLRDNPGGLLDGAVDVGGQIFSKDTTIVIEEGKKTKEELKTSGPATLKQVKLVVLVNGGSASASEILAGAVKDNKRGKIIGEKTFGKGTVQQLDQLSDGSSTKITVSRWLTPNGTSIDKDGITPDIEEKEGDNPLFDLQDPLLKRALSEIAK